jgi:hypothetical protein
MILHALSGYDFSKEEIKFVDLLSCKARNNILVDITDLNELKKEMKKKGISPDILVDLCKKMQNNQILEYHNMGGHTWITLNSLQVIAFQTRLKQISCPKCHKRPLRTKTITYCPDCGYESDQEGKTNISK